MAGDHNQLPPIGVGNVLRDLMAANSVAITFLESVMLQAGILKECCAAILNGQVVPTKTDEESQWNVENGYLDSNSLRNRILEKFKQRLNFPGFDPVLDFQLLSPTHKGILGTTQLNLNMQAIFQSRLNNIDVDSWHDKIAITGNKNKKTQQFFLYDKVVATKNDYELNIMNGMLGQISGIGKNKEILINFDGEQVSYGKMILVLKISNLLIV